MKQAALLLAVLLLVSCREGRFVDKESAGAVDTGIRAELQRNDTIINQSDTDFVTPPSYNASNATINLQEKQTFVGKDAVKLWVWNERGSEKLLLTEGAIVELQKLGIVVEAVLISTDGRVLVRIDDKAAKPLIEKQETRVGSTWIFISDVFLNEAEE